jgi:hypothetical protein
MSLPTALDGRPGINSGAEQRRPSRSGLPPPLSSSTSTSIQPSGSSPFLFQPPPLPRETTSDRLGVRERPGSSSGLAHLERPLSSSGAAAAAARSRPGSSSGLVLRERVAFDVLPPLERESLLGKRKSLASLSSSSYAKRHRPFTAGDLPAPPRFGEEGNSASRARTSSRSEEEEEDMEPPPPEQLNTRRVSIASLCGDDAPAATPTTRPNTSHSLFTVASSTDDEPTAAGAANASTSTAAANSVSAAKSSPLRRETATGRA